MAHVYIALGSNQSTGYQNSKALLRAAIAALPAHGFEAIRSSRFFASPAFPAGSGPDYVNAVIGCETALTPEAALSALHEVEAAFERKRAARWAPRSLDLDLLDYSGEIRPDAQTLHHWITLPLDAQKRDAPERLILPHPRLQDRAFVLIPLREVAPDWVHPALHRSINGLIDALPPYTLTPL